jgi:hypothetical protein
VGKLLTINNNFMENIEIITKEESRIEKVEKMSKGEVVLDENNQPVLEDKEIIEQKEYVRITNAQDIDKEAYIAQLERAIADDDAEIARRQAHKAISEDTLNSLIN